MGKNARSCKQATTGFGEGPGFGEGLRPRVRRGSPNPGFGEGLPTPPKRPTEGLLIRPGDLRSATWPVRDRPQQATTGQVGDRPQQRSETGHNKQQLGSARVSRPRRNVRPKVSPFAHETFGQRRGQVGDRPQQRSETSHNDQRPATTAGCSPANRRRRRIDNHYPPRHNSGGRALNLRRGRNTVEGEAAMSCPIY